MTCANTSPPLGLGWDNITVSIDGKAVSRGIALAVGNPQQVVSLRPSVGDDNTWLFNSADCLSAANDSCIGLKGGVFNPNSSSTYSPTFESAWNGSHDAAIADGSYLFFNDHIRFGSNGSSLGFPLYMDQPGQGSQSGLGIGPGSTFLKAAVDSGSAPSKAWGLWVGSRSVAQPADGALWIGGYDTNRIGGEWTDFTVHDHCPTCVQVTNITYEYLGGSASLFSNASETLTVTLEPFQRALNMPEDIFLNFARVSNGTVGTYPGTQALLTYPPATQFGNLIITINNGLGTEYQTTIPAQELFLPPRNFNADGQYAISNDTYVLAGLANATVNPGYVFDWGIPFLTMNYMVVDYDQKKFRLAPALQGPYGVSNGALVQPLCSGIAPLSTSAAAGPTYSTTVTPPQNTITPSPIPEHRSSTNVGVIVGGVVGGVGGFLIVGILLFFLLRSRRREKAARNDRDAAVAEAHDTKQKTERLSQYTGTSPTEVSEMGANNNMEHWLNTQHGVAEEAHMYPPSATVNRPFEMPAHSY